jgi:hypothetical protein
MQVDEVDEPERLAAFRRAVANPALRRVLSAYFLFNVAEWADWIALLVWAYGRDGVRGASTMALVQLVPASLLAPSVARVLSRMPPTRAITLGYAAQAVTFLATGTALAFSAPYVVVAVLALCSAVAVTATRPVHNSLLPVLSDTTPQLTAANAVSGALEASASFLGPLLCAALIVGWGPEGVVLTVGAAMLLATVLTARLPRPMIVAGRADGADDGALSVRTVLGNSTARTLSGMVAAEYVLVGMLDILLVALALEILFMADSGPGLLQSAMGLGGLLGSVLTVLLVGRSRMAPALVLGALGAGIPIAVSGATSLPAVACVLMAVAGAGKVYFDVASRTLVQRSLPDRMLVAVFGVQEAMMMAGLALGSLLAPVLVSLVGVSWAFAAAGLFLPLVTLLSWRGLTRADAMAQVPQDVFELLRGVPFLGVLAPRVVERLALEATRADVAQGAELIREGDTGEDFYVLVDGDVEVSRNGRFVRTLGPGAWFGELALLRSVPRTATVRVTHDAEVVVLGRGPFLTAVTGAPQSVAAADEHATGYEA